MRSNTTGGLGTLARAGADDGIGELPENIQRDVDRVAELLAAGFRGRLWQQTADELFGYSYRPLLHAMRHTDKLVRLTAKSMTPLQMNDEERSALHRNPDDRADLAVRTIYVALETFPTFLSACFRSPVLSSFGL